MKKRIAYILMSVLVMTAGLGLVACGSDNNEETQTTAAQTTENNEVSTPAPTEKEEDTTATVDDNKVAYKVKVVDEADNPIASAMVQMCKDACVPAMTNADGIAEFNLAEDDYDVKFIELPAGYTYSGADEVFKFASGETELTITLKVAE